MVDSNELDLSDTDREALHELQLGIEQIYRGYGSLLEFHHTIGRGMDHLDDAEAALRKAGHEEIADRIRDEQLPAGLFEGTWTYELVEAFERDFLGDVTSFEADVREQLADGHRHITEREQQRNWNERAENQNGE
jgi:hypothetical protein